MVCNLQQSVAFAIKKMQGSSKACDSHWYMWCLRHAEGNSDRPKLDPSAHPLPVLSGFISYRQQHIESTENPEKPKLKPVALAKEETEGVAQQSIPYLWHVMSGSWDGMDKCFRANILDIRSRSELFELKFWSHEDVGAWFEEKQMDGRARNCFYSIDSTYGAARADFFRYHILLEMGGIWCDHKAVQNLPGGWKEMFDRLP